jgi:hypothetical protein
MIISVVRFSWAEIFEDHLQTPRLSKLRRCFGAAAEVRFAPRAAAAQRFLGAGFLGDARGFSKDWLGKIRGKIWKYAEKYMV